MQISLFCCHRVASGVTIIDVGNELPIRVQILTKHFCDLDYSNTLERGINSTVFSPALDKRFG